MKNPRDRRFVISIMVAVLCALALNPIVASPKEKSLHGEVFVQGGTFRMGSETGLDFEKPVHSVTISSFWIMKTEVTQKEYAALMGTNPSETKGDELPVETVTWYDALLYANKLSVRDGLKPVYRETSFEWDKSADGWRLPTEAEWEYASLGGALSRGYTHAGGNDPGTVGWYDANSDYKSQPVGTKAPNELGLYDMSGNVFEWCWDWWGSYNSTAQTNPSGAASGMTRVVRGGGFVNNASAIRSAARGQLAPNTRGYGIGFRLVRSQVP